MGGREARSASSNGKEARTLPDTRPIRRDQSRTGDLVFTLSMAPHSNVITRVTVAIAPRAKGCTLKPGPRKRAAGPRQLLRGPLDRHPLRARRDARFAIRNNPPRSGVNHEVLMPRVPRREKTGHRSRPASARPAGTRSGRVATTSPRKPSNPCIRQRPCVCATEKCP